MAGYASRDRPADGKVTELYSKAMVFELANQTRAVIVTLDLVGIDRELRPVVDDEAFVRLLRDTVQIQLRETVAHRRTFGGDVQEERSELAVTGHGAEVRRPGDGFARCCDRRDVTAGPSQLESGRDG